MTHKSRIATLALCLCMSAQAHALEIIFNDTTIGGPIDPIALAGFEDAAAIWEGLLGDDITVRIDVSFETLPPGALGGTSRNFDDQVLYSLYRDALIADATSAADALATASLTDTGTFNYAVTDLDGDGAFAINPDGFGTLDINTKLDVNTATLKALGLLADDGTTADALIEFSDSFDFDFDRSDGIDAGAFDFVGVAAHEIGHALGFISGVDFLDFNTWPNGPGAIADGPFSIDDLMAVPFGFVTPLDLFRYSADVRDIGIDQGWDPLRDLTLGGFGEVYFSLDSGATSLGTFSTGFFNGDGDQASHWDDDLGLGLMDPTASRGELLAISSLDLLAYDAIGWDIRTVPEPGTLGLLALGLLVLASSRWRRRVAV